jgi:hypothetical protein
MKIRAILPVLKCWTLWYALALLGMPLLLLAGEPATQPADQAQDKANAEAQDKANAEAQDKANAERQAKTWVGGGAGGPRDGVIKLPDGRELNLADLAAQGGGVVMVNANAGDGNKDLTVTEDGRTVTIHEVEGEEIVVTVTEDGAEPKEYRAANAEELEKNHPEAFELYQKYAGDMLMHLPAMGAMAGGGGAMIGQQFRVAIGGPGMHHGPLGAMGGGKVEALGAVCSPVFDDFVRTQLGDGVMVFKVGKDSVGQRIGLERHDLIKSVNGDEVTYVEDLLSALVNAGDKLTIEVVRKGKPVTLQEK